MSRSSPKSRPGASRSSPRWCRLELLERLIDRIRVQLSEGAQVYWVCPLIETSEVTELAAAEERHAYLRADLRRSSRPAARRAGSDKAKDETMAAFAAGKLKILVATTVIEVGVNVPNANIMVIEHAERFGLAQLHQLRGRVGRGTRESPSACCFTSRPLGETAGQRLAMMERTEDGFLIAEKDLELQRRRRNPRRAAERCTGLSRCRGSRL